MGNLNLWKDWGKPMKLVCSFTDLNMIIEINKYSLCPKKTEFLSSFAFCDLGRRVEKSQSWEHPLFLKKARAVILSGCVPYWVWIPSDLSSHDLLAFWPDGFVCLFICLRCNLTMLPWLTWNSLCRLSWPWTQRDLFVFASQVLKGIHHHAWLKLVILKVLLRFSNT